MVKSLLWLLILFASLLFGACAGMRLKLTHVDAKDNCTVEERMSRAAARTRTRLASMGGAAAPIHWAGDVNGGQYIAEYLIGEPPQKADAIIDTGSNLVWTQCAACRSAGTGCFRQNLRYYNPSQSRTVRPVSCDAAACALGSETQCTEDKKACAVVTGYGAGTIAGVLGTETFTFQPEKVSLAFGCIEATRITRGALDGASGIIGLGRGGLSIVSQLRETKFSYCLTPYFRDAIKPSHLFVGESAALSGSAPVTSVPFVKNPKDDPYNTFYFLPLTGITVGKVKLNVPAAAFGLRRVSPGTWTGTLIDSGSPFTSLVDVAYLSLRKELARQLGASLVHPPVEGYELCVAQGVAGKVVPPLVLHFGSGGGDVVVPPVNYWAPVDRATACMVVFSSGGPDEPTIIGNFMQQNMHLLYDLAKGTLSFQPADCTSI